MIWVVSLLSMKLSPHRLTRKTNEKEFGVWLNKLGRNHVYSSSSSTSLQKYLTAIPRDISERTSYYRVRLEFLPYPQLIPEFCTARGFGPPHSFTYTSPCPWIDHSVSGLFHTTNRPIKTRFRYGSPALNGLTLPYKITRRLVLQKACSHRMSEDTRLLLVVSVQFQDLFHSPCRGSFRLSLTVLVHYRSQKVFSLAGVVPADSREVPLASRYLRAI